MKKIFTLLMLVVAFTFTASAQLPDGAWAPDFTMTDINGEVHHLYDYTDAGYTVILDFSATWCGPCWSYHTGGTLEEIYENHGPAGMPGVSANTTDDMMVFMIEGDASTTDDQLHGIGAGTAGNWVEGTPYPIIDDASMTSPYSIAYWPTMYTVCPNRQVFESGQVTAAEHYAYVGTCPVSTHESDAIMISLNSAPFLCGDSYFPEVTFQSMNLTNTMTNATIVVSQNDTELLSYDWTGSLERYDYDDVVLPEVTGVQSGVPLEFRVDYTDDMDNANDAIMHNLILPSDEVSTMTITIDLTTDQYGSETSWDFIDGENNILASGDNLSSSTTYSEDVDVDINGCYMFVIRDSYGDGICCGFGNGSYSLKDDQGNELYGGGDFGDGETQLFTNVDDVSVEENTSVSSLNIFPNPVSETANMKFNLTSNLDTDIQILNVLGEVVYFESLGVLSQGQHNTTIDVKSLNDGVYFINILSEGNITSKKITVIK